ncbi:hypothetical protein PR001_g9504 [Phytophthora rubi]|uniref:Uncharacterized protein n=1 Tax=Phytophthora rubi TaxID=129364 RepID=A0A6A3MUC5_9STRA|nr:hypothetical protein PR001_g9504 [Phytophthora rubi]
METLMDHYGNVAAERKLRTPGSKVRGCAARQEAASGSVVAASELEHGKLRLASSKVRGRLWRAWRWWRR